MICLLTVRRTYFYCSRLHNRCSRYSTNDISLLALSNKIQHTQLSTYPVTKPNIFKKYDQNNDLFDQMEYPVTLAAIDRKIMNHLKPQLLGLLASINILLAWEVYGLTMCELNPYSIACMGTGLVAILALTPHYLCYSRYIGKISLLDKDTAQVSYINWKGKRVDIVITIAQLQEINPDLGINWYNGKMLIHDSDYRNFVKRREWDIVFPQHKHQLMKYTPKD